ncbi:MAG TPA: plasmid partition protein ParG [Clostridia bacterium]|nr:plasmid partition protein ParG [Clostridia bacterium]
MAEVKVKRMNINVEVTLHDAFKAATAARGVNMTDVLLQFIEDYVAKNGVSPKKKTGRK